MKKRIRIGTRESQLALWQATLVKNLLAENGHDAELVTIKSEGDIDLKTPLYEMGVQGIFTRSLDIALLNDQIDLAVHSMKDVPTQLPAGILQAAVLERATYKDLIVYKNDTSFLNDFSSTATIATSSTRRKAQWLNRYPNHTIVNLRGNVNTRLKKLAESNWDGAIFAAAGLERIGLRPSQSLDLDWMLPAPAQGAIMIVCRKEDSFSFQACQPLNDTDTALCTKIERDFLHSLMGGCTTPISALAIRENNKIIFKGNICTPDGKERKDIEKVFLDTRSFIKTEKVNTEELKALLKNLAQQKITAVYTSKNAERAVNEYLKEIPEPADWNIFSITNQPGVHNAEQLADVIINNGIKEVVFFCGDKRRDELPEKLKCHGIKVNEVITYHTIETPHLVPTTFDGILFYSPSSVKSFFSVNNLPAETTCYAMGETTASEIKNYCTNDISIRDFKKGII